MNSSCLLEAHSVLTAGQTFCADIKFPTDRAITKESLLDWDEWDEGDGA